MMGSKYLTLIRRFTTSSSLRQSYLSQNYKTKEIWDKRFNCRLLGSDEAIIKTINQKIISGNQLDNIEADIFINIAAPASTETAQLQESLSILGMIRKSLYANTLLPSTHHALCRLFLYSDKIDSLILVLENRVKFGIFPDFYALNLLLDATIDKKDYASGARIAAQVMYQEEFGVNTITDSLSLLAISNYIEKKTNFNDWKTIDEQDDNIINPESTMDNMNDETNQNEAKENDGKKESDDGEEEEEEDAEYIRVPFLRNPYHDNHFDVKEPRIICGKTLSMISHTLINLEANMASQADLLGLILQTKWTKAAEKIDNPSLNIDKSIKSLCRFYLDNLDGLAQPDEAIKSKLTTYFGDSIENEEPVLSKFAESRCSTLSDAESLDINEFNKNLAEWSNLRQTKLEEKKQKFSRQKLIDEIRTKKQELKEKEQYLYFYDNLKKSKITRIQYD